jgi:hypothetical protein
MAKAIESRLERLEAIQRLQHTQSTPPRFEIVFHAAEDGRDAGVAFLAWLGDEAGESKPASNAT